MKERGMILQAWEVRALLDGSKTQKRAPIKIQPPDAGYQLAACVSTTGNKRDKGRHHWVKLDGHRVVDASQPYFSKPYGEIGDRIWVRESFQPLFAVSVDRNGNGHIDYKTGKGYTVSYPATDDVAEFYSPFLEEIVDHVTPSVRMPRWASRITLEITNVRVERLHDISEADAMAEGVRRFDEGFHTEHGQHYSHDPRETFASRWGSTSFDKNEWMWVYEFNKVSE